jgi:hypothetical protein
MTKANKPPADLEEALLSAVPKDPDTARPVEDPESISEAVHRQVDNAINQNPDLQKTPEQLYETLLKPGIHDAIIALGLTPVIQKCKAKLHNAHEGNRARFEKKVTKWLMNAFKTKNIPFKKWGGFFPDAMAIEGAANCSGSALVFGVIMNEEFGIKTEHVNPIGHAANLVTFSDGTTQYVDPRNRVNFKLKLGDPKEIRDGFKIYDISRSSLEYRLLPVSELKHGATLTLLENLCELEKAQDSDPEAMQTIDNYGDDIDFDFARRYMEGNFLRLRDSEEEWQEEERYRDTFRRRRDYFLIPGH